jgi:hypothetical protein
MNKYRIVIIALSLLFSACTGPNHDGLTSDGYKITRWIKFLEPQVRENIFPAFSSEANDKIYLSGYKVLPRKGNKLPIMFLLDNDGTLIERVDIPTDFDFNTIIAQDTHGEFIYLLIRQGLMTGRFELAKLDKDATLIKRISLPNLPATTDYRMQISHDRLFIAAKLEDRIYSYHYNSDLLLLGQDNFPILSDNWLLVGDRIAVLTSKSNNLVLDLYSSELKNIVSYPTSLEFKPEMKLVELSEDYIVLLSSARESSLVRFHLPDMKKSTLKLNRFIRDVIMEENGFVLVTDNRNKLREGINLMKVDYELNLIGEYSIFKGNNYRYNSVQSIGTEQYLISGTGFFPNARFRSIPRLFLLKAALVK